MFTESQFDLVEWILDLQEDLVQILFRLNKVLLEDPNAHAIHIILEVLWPLNIIDIGIEFFLLLIR